METSIVSSEDVLGYCRLFWMLCNCKFGQKLAQWKRGTGVCMPHFHLHNNAVERPISAQMQRNFIARSHVNYN